jgi:hypothetical protein
MQPRARRQYPSVAALVVASLTLAVTGCASAGPAATTATPSPTVSIPAEGFVTVTPTTTLNWDDVSATLAPLDPATTGLVSASAAYAKVADGIRTILATAQPVSAPRAGLYSYTNSAHGALRPDGSVLPNYTNVPVWAFIIPLARFVDDSQGGVGASPVPSATRSQCHYYYLVQARTAELLTSGEQCTTILHPATSEPTTNK